MRGETTMTMFLACLATGAIVALMFSVRERNGWKDRFLAENKSNHDLRGWLRFAELDLAQQRGQREARETDGVYRLVENGLKNGDVVVASRQKGGKQGA